MKINVASKPAEPAKKPEEKLDAQNISNPATDLGTVERAAGVVPGTPAAQAADAQAQAQEKVIVDNTQSEAPVEPAQAEPKKEEDDTRPLSERLQTYESNYTPGVKKVEKFTPDDQSDCF